MSRLLKKFVHRNRCGPFSKNMKFKIYILCLTLAACTNAGQESSSIATKTDDSTEIGIDLAQVRKEFISTYLNPVLIDTSFYWEDSLYKVKFTHYATMDSGLTVPSLYNFDTNKDFVTHNFKSNLLIMHDADTLLTKEITKQTFKEYLRPELDSFATLLFPNFYIKGDTIKLSYSLTIPVTDVGIHVEVKFDIKGYSTISN